MDFDIFLEKEYGTRNRRILKNTIKEQLEKVKESNAVIRKTNREIFHESNHEGISNFDNPENIVLSIDSEIASIDKRLCEIDNELRELQGGEQ